MKSAHEIGLEIDELDKQINEACRNRDAVRVEIIHKRRDISNIRLDISKLEESLIKAECVVREMKTKRTALNEEFWNAKDLGT